VKLKSLVLKHLIVEKQALLFAVLAFSIPACIRSIPQILAGPYPIGFDTIRYISDIQTGYVFSIGPIGFFKGTNLFYLLATLPYWLSHNAVLTMNVLGPIMLGLLSFMIYLYARKSLCWTGWKSLLVAVLVGVYFVSLRNSWDLYRQTLGIIFLLGALISLKYFSSPRRYYVSSVLMLFTVLSHELAAAILFFVIGIQALNCILKKSAREFMALLLCSILPLVIFLFQIYTPQDGSIHLPSVAVATSPSLGLSLYIGGLIIFCYALISPFIFLGAVKLGNTYLLSWILLCLGIPLLEMVDPNLPLYFWYRWILLLVYPLMFFFVEGLYQVWRYSSQNKSKVKKIFLKAFVIVYLISIFTLSGFYLTTTPDNPTPYLQLSPYYSSIPSSMLQNSISIKDNPSIVDCFNWINLNITANSAVIEHYALYDLAIIYVHNHSIVSIGQQSSTWSNNQNTTTYLERMELTAEVELSSGHDAVYTVWWTEGKGWYGIPALSTNFKEVFHSGNLAVYSFDSNV
jgi:hypothetical protein